MYEHEVNCLKRAFGKFEERGKTVNNVRKNLLALARSKSYRVHITKANNGGSGFSAGRTISFWCFAPALAMRELSFLNVRSILITSGTLSPLPSFSMELGLHFPVQLENDHVIQSDQIFVRVVGKGVSGKELSSKFGRRDDPEYLSELGNTLASLCRNIPGGVLVFFLVMVQWKLLSNDGEDQHLRGLVEGSLVAEGVQLSLLPRKGSKLQQSVSGQRAFCCCFFVPIIIAVTNTHCSSLTGVFPMVPSHFRSTSTDSTPWQRLLARKSIVLEPRSTSELTECISEYKRFITTPNSTGAILMGELIVRVC